MRQQHPYSDRYVTVVVFLSLLLTSMGCAPQDSISHSNDHPESSDAAQDAQAALKEPVEDIHYGLLVYMDQLDERLSLGPVARFVLAVHRREGQEFPPTHEKPEATCPMRFNARIQRFGRNLRQAMSDEERSRFETLVKEGYLFGVETLPDGVNWRSRHGMAGKVGMQSYSIPNSTARRWTFSKPIVPQQDDFDVPDASTAARILRIEEIAVRKEALRYLAKVDMDPRCRKEVLNVLMAVQKEPPLKRSQYLSAVFTRWATAEDLDEVERMLTEGNLSERNLMRVFLHMGKLDQQRAVEYVIQRATGIALAFLADYKLGERVAQMVFVQDRILPDLLAEGRFAKTSERLDSDFDKTELDSLYRAMIVAFLQSGEKDHMIRAANLIRYHFPELKAKAIPYFKNTEKFSFLYNMAIRFESDLKSESR